MDTEFSVKLRMEQLPKSKLTVFLFVFFLVFLVCAMIAFVLSPPIIKSHAMDIYKCDSVVTEMCYSNTTTHEVWSGVIPGAGRLNQLLYMTATPYAKDDIEFNMTMEILVTHQSKILADNLKQKLITCKSGKCNTIVIFYLPYLEFSEYRVIIRHKSRILSDMVEINVSFIDALYSKYQLGTKYGFFGLSVIGLAQFVVYSCKIPLSMWSFEAKMVLLIGPSLIVFNEPLLWASIYLMNPFWSAISVFCNAQFIAVLLVFWILGLQQYRSTRYIVCYLVFEILLISLLFVLIFTAYLYVHDKLRFDPTYDWQHDLSYKYKEIFVGILVVALVIMAWILYLALRALKNVRKATARKRYMMILNVIFIGFGFIGIALGAFQPIPKYSSLLLIFESGFNLYVILLEVMYSPTQNSILDYQRDKKIEYTLMKFQSEDSVELAGID